VPAELGLHDVVGAGLGAEQQGLELGHELAPALQAEVTALVLVGRVGRDLRGQLGEARLVLAHLGEDRARLRLVLDEDVAGPDAVVLAMFCW
jgi:hypothetical protein